MPKRDFDITLLAGANRGGQFPPGLNTFDPPTNLRPDESPDCYGLDMAREGRIATGTQPSGTARIAKSITIEEGQGADAWAESTGYSEDDLVTETAKIYRATADHTSGDGTAGNTFADDLAAGLWVQNLIPYLWHYRRLWNVTGRTVSGTTNVLKVGAQNYDVKYFQQAPDVPFTEDANAILGVIPFGDDSLAVIKTTGSYVLSNCNDTRGTRLIQRTPLVQELRATAAANAVELDGALYVSNTGGLIAYQGGKSVELSRKVRDGLTNFSNKALVADYDKARIIGGTEFVYELATEKLFSWATSGFRYTTPQWHLPDYAPVAVDGVIFTVENADNSSGTLSYQIKYDDGEWGDVNVVQLDAEIEGRSTLVFESMWQSRQSRRFQLRLTALSSNKYIKEIRVEASDATLESYAE